MSVFVRVAVVVVSLVAYVSIIHGQSLPLKVYTSSDGLASSVIHDITRDSDGFLWFAARGGLTRYDGNEFVIMRFTDSPSSPLVHRFFESRDGRYFWIAADNGLYRVRRETAATAAPINEQTRPGERRLDADQVTRTSFWTVFETSDGRLIGGTAGGVFEMVDRDAPQAEFRRLEYSKTAAQEHRTAVRDLTEAPDGSLWAAADAGIVRQLPDGRWITYEIPLVIATGNESYSIVADQAGRIWASYRSGVFIIKPEPAEQLGDVADQSTRKLPIQNISIGVAGNVSLPEKPGDMAKLEFTGPNERISSTRAGRDVGSGIQAIASTSDGAIWVPTDHSLYRFENGVYQRLRDANDRPGISTRIAEDSNGDIWFGTFTGAVKYSQRGLTSYSTGSGLVDPSTFVISESSGHLMLSHGLWQTSTLGPEGFETRQLNLPSTARYLWTAYPSVPDKTGAIWALSTFGLYRFPPRASLAEEVKQTPERAETSFPILKDKGFYRAFNDRKGRIWFSAVDTPTQQRYLFRYDPSTGEWADLSTLDGFPRNKTIGSFAEDAQGNVWFGFYNVHGLLKFDGTTFKEYGVESGIPGGAVIAMLIDMKGRLWIGSNEEGITRIENLDGPQFTITRYTEKQGLTSNNVRCLVEDASGRIYAGTVRGVTQIDPEKNQTKLISTNDGLAADFVQSAYRDRDGDIWFGTSNGVSRLKTSSDDPASAPPVFITSLQVAGVPYGLSGLGQRSISGLGLDPSQNNLQIAFTAVGNALRFQYKLDGGNDNDWRASNEGRSIDFANLAPGSYSFLVRAITTNGAISDKPATVSFTIDPPVWRRWWFIALILLTVGAAAFSVERYRTVKARQINNALRGQLKAERELIRSREERFKELERVRTRIATDLHDDIGSSLTQIAVLSEVARGAASNIHADDLAHPLDRIKTVSKELVAVMSDVVWAINPQKDFLQDLIQRMRRFGSDIFSSRGIAFELIAPQSDENLQLGANIRREVFAIFKEAANNAAKYSQCTSVKCEFKVDHNQLVLKIVDNGVGFDTQTVLSEDFKPEIGGNGLVGMRRRAADLGGLLSVDSGPNAGSVISLSVPLHSQENGTA